MSSEGASSARIGLLVPSGSPFRMSSCSLSQDKHLDNGCQHLFRCRCRRGLCQSECRLCLQSHANELTASRLRSNVAKIIYVIIGNLRYLWQSTLFAAIYVIGVSLSSCISTLSLLRELTEETKVFLDRKLEANLGRVYSTINDEWRRKSRGYRDSR